MLDKIGRLWQRLAQVFSSRDLFEAALVAISFLAYFGVRGLVIDRPERAYWHARDLIELQRKLGIFWEYELQKRLLDNIFIIQSLNIIYFWLHFPLIIAFGIWCYYNRRYKYTVLRDAFLASGVISLIIYWLYPVAPPRLLPELAQRFEPAAPIYVRGFVDTMQVYLGYAYQTQETRAFVNPYAAMPSLHFGWDMLLGIGIIWAFWGSRLIWLAVPIGVFLPFSQVIAISITANHFFMDALAGAAVSLVGLGIAWALQRWFYPRLALWGQHISWPAMRRLLLSMGTDPHPRGGKKVPGPKASSTAGEQR